jgi:molybdate transport system ATP-binding protein
MDPAATLSVHVSQRLSGGFVVAPGLDATLERGALLVLFGPSGAGKTTMLRQIAGLERPDAGAIRFNGAPWCDVERNWWVPPQARRVGMVFQAPTLFPHLSVRENIAYGVVDRSSMPVAIEELARLLGVGSLLDRAPRALSGGEAQRVAVARALAPGPGLVLLDEPFAALDAPARLRLRRDVRALLHRTGTPAILVTHDRAEALAMADQAAIVVAGRIRQVGPVAEVFSHPSDIEVAASLGVEAVLPARVTASADGLLDVSVGSVVLHVAERVPASDALAPGSDVYACIRAEDVALESRAPSVDAAASTRNHLPACVVAIAPEGAVDRVTLDCGFQLDALITRRSREDMRLAPGTIVTVAIKATSVHLVPRA